jgi:hypothetical protein
MPSNMYFEKLHRNQMKVESLYFLHGKAGIRLTPSLSISARSVLPEIESIPYHSKNPKNTFMSLS